MPCRVFKSSLSNTCGSHLLSILILLRSACCKRLLQIGTGSRVCEVSTDCWSARFLGSGSDSILLIQKCRLVLYYSARMRSIIILQNHHLASLDYREGVGGKFGARDDSNSKRQRRPQNNRNPAEQGGRYNNIPARSPLEQINEPNVADSNITAANDLSSGADSSLKASEEQQIGNSAASRPSKPKKANRTRNQNQRRPKESEPQTDQQVQPVDQWRFENNWFCTRSASLFFLEISRGVRWQHDPLERGRNWQMLRAVCS